MDPGLHRPSPHAFGRAERAGLRGSGSLKLAWNAAEPDEGENKPKTTTRRDLSKRLKLHGIKRQKVPKKQGLKKHQKNHSLACKKSSRISNTKRTLM